MPEIKKAIVKSYDAATHKATIQIAGSLGVWLDGLRVATDIPATDVVVGRQCTVLFLDPSNQDDAVVLTIQGALPSGGGGSSDHSLLSNLDYPSAAHTGFVASAGVAGGQTIKGGTAASEILTLESTAHASKGYIHAKDQLRIGTGTSGVITDPTGNSTITIAIGAITLAPFLGTLPINLNAPVVTTTTVKAGGNIGVHGVTPATNKLIHAGANVGTFSGAYYGIDLGFSGTTSGNSCILTGVFANAVNLSIGASSTGHYVKGLDFTLAASLAVGSTISQFIAAACRLSLAAYEGTVTLARGLYIDTPLITAPGAAMSVQTYNGVEVNAPTSNKFVNYAGLRVHDATAPTGNIRLLEIGPSTPYLRLLGGGNPGANLTNLYLNENGTLRRVQWKDGASIGAGDKVMVLV